MNFEYEENRIYANDENGNLIAEITFPPVSDDTVIIDHTFVDPSLRGQGVAAKLVRAATDQIRETGKKAEVSCVYAVRGFDEHPDDCDILVG